MQKGNVRSPHKSGASQYLVLVGFTVAVLTLSVALFSAGSGLICGRTNNEADAAPVEVNIGVQLDAAVNFRLSRTVRRIAYRLGIVCTKDPDGHITVTNAFFKQLNRFENLFASWRHVRQRARRSSSIEIRNAAEDFELHSPSSLRSIQSKLGARTFTFTPAEGILKDKVKREKAGKSPRPIVLADIESRIVQRAILQCLQPEETGKLGAKIGRIKEVNQSIVNFGGTPSGGVPRAVKQLMDYVADGHQLFFKSDIASFFTHVPHDKIIQFVAEEIEDSDFVDVFTRAMKVQLKNADELKDYLSLFPSDEIGVAQGSSLSAFAGNIYLHDLDFEMIKLENVKMVRYIDDLILVARSNEALQGAKSNLIRALKKKNLNVYDPSKHKDKAAEGHFRDGVEFLGCLIHPGQVEPSRKAKSGLVAKVKKEIELSRRNIEKFRSDIKIERNREITFAQSLVNIDNMVRGWANSFRFSTSRLSLGQVDEAVGNEVNSYREWFARTITASSKQRARVLGVYVAADVKFKPLSEYGLAKTKNS